MPNGLDVDGWEYKRLELVDGRVVEDGERLSIRTLNARSLELISKGWEPIEASELHRRYRRPAVRLQPGPNSQPGLGSHV